MPRYALGDGVLDVLQGVSGAGVLGGVPVLVVDLAALAVHRDVLQHAPEADGVVDLVLLLLGEVDGLGVAAPLEVEDALLGPAVLVVAYQPALGVRRERGLAGPGEPEE